MSTSFNLYTSCFFPLKNKIKTKTLTFEKDQKKNHLYQIFLFPRLPVSKSTSLDDDGAGKGVDRPIDSGMSRLTLMEGPVVARS